MGPSCQSCGVPMDEPDMFGTNADGGVNREYCHFCFQNGDFTEPNLTLQQMIDKVAGFMAQMQNMPESQAKEMAKGFLPSLKRWRG